MMKEYQVSIGFRFVWLAVLVNIPAALFGGRFWIPNMCIVIQS